MKTDLGEAEAEMPKTHEVGFDMSLHQVKYFFKEEKRGQRFTSPSSSQALMPGIHGNNEP